MFFLLLLLVCLFFFNKERTLIKEVHPYVLGNEPPLWEGVFGLAQPPECDDEWVLLGQGVAEWYLQRGGMDPTRRKAAGSPKCCTPPTRSQDLGQLGCRCLAKRNLRIIES